jgi:hypothetical protein
MGLSSSGQHVSLVLRPDRPLPGEQIREEQQLVLPIPNIQAQQASLCFLNGGGCCNCYDSTGSPFIGVGPGPFLYERMPQGLKAIHSAGFMYGLKPVPTSPYLPCPYLPFGEGQV